MNYRYDKIDNLKKDIAEGIDTIRWTVYGKINKIVKGAASTNISYNYDASGNRTVKEVAAHDTLTKTFYVRDTQGNVMAVYKKDAGNLKWEEQHLYGSSRLGMWRWSDTIPSNPPTADNGSIYDSLLYGSRNYELTNHLGNVLATISDKKIGHAINDTTVDYFNADVVNANDYYPGGMLMPGRSYVSTNSYRYGFNGKEKDNTDGVVQYDYGFRIYDPRLVRFKSVDPLISSYPYYTPYQFAGNMPIAAIDLDGLEQHVVIYYKDQQGKTTEIQVRSINDNNGTVLNQHVHKVSDTKDIAKGNVLVFESYQKNSDYENMKIIEKRNTSDSKLTLQEHKIFNKYKEKEKETGETQSLGYGGYLKGEPQYESQEFENADTKTYSASFGIVPPPTFQGQTLSPNKKFTFDAMGVYGDQINPPPFAEDEARNLGKALKNTGISSVIIQPTFMDASGGEGANTMQKNGKPFIQNYNEQFQKLGQIIKKASGGKVNVTMQYPKVSKTSLAGKGLDIQTK